MRVRAIFLAAMLVLAPLGARGADLVVWWEEGSYPQEDEAVREIVAAFEHKIGKQVELTFHPPQELGDKIVTALRAGQPPDFAFGVPMVSYILDWAFDDRLVDLTGTVNPFSDLFEPDALTWWVVPDGRTGQKALYALPMGRSTNHLHVWRSLLEQAGLADIPKEWHAFWSFWCDRVQPAVRHAIGRSDIWGVGLNMSAAAPETELQFFQFVAAYEADYVTRDGRLMINDPEVRQRLVKAIDSYTAIYRKGCTPPDAVSWDNAGNNKAFLSQTVVMTANETLSIPNALKRERPDDYHEHSATIEWPLGPRGETYALKGDYYAAAVFKDGGHAATSEEFVRFLVAEGWLAHWLDFAGERMLPPMPRLLNQPFWLNPGDQHRMASVMLASSRPLQYVYPVASGDRRHDVVSRERIWPKAVRRVAADGLSPEQAVDEAIARIKQLLSK